MQRIATILLQGKTNPGIKEYRIHENYTLSTIDSIRNAFKLLLKSKEYTTVINAMDARFKIGELGTNIVIRYYCLLVCLFVISFSRTTSLIAFLFILL